MSQFLRRSTLLAAAAVLASPTRSDAASFTWDGTTTSYVLTSSDDFNLLAGATGSVGLAVTARDLNLNGDATIGGAFSFTQTGGGGLYQGIDLLASSSTITATSISLTGDIGRQNADGGTLVLSTSAANGNIDLNVSLGRANVWYIPAGLTANAGTGTITVSGTNGQGWRTTPVTLSGGAVNFTGSVSSSAAVSVTNSLASSIANGAVLSGSMSLAKAGAGTLTISNGSNSFTGNITISAGRVIAAAASGTAQGSSPSNSALGNMTTSGRTITVGNGAGSTAVLEFAASDAIGAYNYLTPVTFIVDGGTITRHSSTTFNSIGAITLRNGGKVVTTNGNAGVVGSFAFNGTITVDGTSATAASIEPLAGQNTNNYINLGTVGGSTTFNITNTTATNALTVSSRLGDRVLGGAGGLIKTGGGTMTLANGGNTFTGNITVSGGKLVVTAASSTAMSATPSESALGNMTTSGRTITVDGSGSVLEFNVADAMGAFGYASPVTLIAKNGGVISRASTGGAFNSVGAVTLEQGGELRANNGSSGTVQSLSLNGNVTVLGTTLGGTIAASGSTNNGIHLRSVGSSGTLTFDVADTSATTDLNVTANLLNPVQVNYLGFNASGTTAGILKTGAGRMDLSGSNAFSGGLTVRSGSVVAGSNSGLGTGTVTLNDASTGSSNTTLSLNATSGTVTVSNAITVANQGTGTVTLGSITSSGSGQAVFAGAVTLNKATTISGGSAGDRLAFTGGITGTANVTIAGTNRVIFSGSAVNHAGTTTINSGATLQLSDGSGTATSLLHDAQEVAVNGTLNLAKGANNESIGGLSGSGTVNQLVAGDATLTVGGGNASAAFSGSLTNTNGTLGLIKVGSGTQTLTGASTHTGATTVSNGTLALGTGGSLGNTAVSVASGATFTTASGTTVGGSVTVNSGATLTANGTLASTLGVSGTATVASGGSVTGTTTLSAGGNLTLNGTAGAVDVASGSSLRGTGSVGATRVANGTATLTAGNGASGSLTLSSLTFDGTGTLAVGTLANYTSSAAFVVTNALTLSGGPVTLSLPAGVISNGTYKLVSYGITSATLSSFAVSGPVIGARQTGGLEKDEANNVFQYVVAGDSPKWTGANGSAFSGGSNWRLINAGTDTDFLAGDSLLLDDSATSYTVDISGGNVDPAAISFANSASNYVLQGDSGLASGTLAKTGTGDLLINNANAASSVSIAAGSVTLGSSGALGNSAVTLSGGTLNLNGQTTAAAIALAGGSIVGNGTVSGVISGTGSLAKASSGALTLSAQNTFTGGTSVSNGTLVLGNATDTLVDTGAVSVSGGELSLGSNSDTVGAVTVSGGSITGTGTLTGSSYAVSGGAVSAKLGGAGALTKSGAGTATLSAANTYSGGTTIGEGTLAIGDNAALGTGSVALNGGTLALSGQTLANAITLGGGSVSGSGTVSGTLSGSSAFVKSGTGALVLSGAQNPTGGISVTGGTLEISDSLGSSGTYSGAIASNGSGALSLTGNANQTLSGVISGSAGLAKSGSGVLTLSAANTLAGNLTISSGEVRLSASPVGNATAAGDMSVSGRVITVGSGAILRAITGDVFAAYNVRPTASILLDGGTYWRQGKEVNLTNYFNSLGDITLRNGATIRTGSGHVQDVQSLAFNGTVTVDGSTGSSITATAGTSFNGIHLGTVGGSTTFAVSDTGTADDLTVGVQLADRVLGGAAGLTKSGAGRMVLAASNVYSGATTISGGTLAVTSGGGIYRGGYRVANISIASGATLELETWHYNENASSLGGLAALASSITVNGGTIRVTGTTTYGRGITVNSGGATLEAASGATWNLDNAGDGNNAFVYNGNPSLTLTGAGTGNLNKAFSGSGSLTKSGAGTWTLSAASTHSGGTTVSNGTLRLGAAGALGSGSVTISGGSVDLNGQTVANAIALSGGTLAGSGTANGVLSGSGAVTKSSAGTLTLGASNTYSGGTSVSNGTLRVGTDGALGSGAVTLSGGILDVDGRTLANSIVLSGGGITGAATLSGILSGTGGLSKSSAGILTLSGSNTYSGATSVTNGTLRVTGSLAADSAVSVGSGATLAVTGSVGGSVSLASGATLSGTGTLGATTLSDGALVSVADASSGRLTLGALVIGGSSTISVGGLSSSLAAINVTGSVSQSDISKKVVFSLEGLLTNGTYRLLSIDASQSLDLSGFDQPLAPLKGSRQTIALGESLVTDGSLKFLEVTVGGVTPYWNGSAGGLFFGSSSWRSSAAADSAAADYLANDDLILDDTASGTTTIDVDGAYAPSSLTFNNSAKAYELTGFGSLEGSLVKNGSGTLTVSNANAFSDVTLNAGVLRLNGEGAIDGAAVTLAGGELDLNDQETSADIVLAGGSIVGAGTVGGVLSGSGSLSKSSSGNLTLIASNTFTGGTTVSDGVLSLGNATDTLADASSVTVSGGELALGSNSETVATLTVTGGSVTGTGTLTAASYALSGGSVSAILGGSGSLTKSGSGSASLSGANTYSGGTTVSNGTLAVGDDDALGTGAVTLSGGALSLSGQTLGNALVFGGGSVTGSGTLSGAISGASALVKSGNGIITLAGDQTLASGIQVTGGDLVIGGTLGGGTYSRGVSVSSGATLSIASGSDQVISGVISGAGELAKSGAGILTLSGANTFGGDLSITGGEVRVNSQANNTNPTATALGNMTVAGRTIAVSGGATLRFQRSDAIGQYNHKPLASIVLDNATLTRDYNTAPTGGGPTEYFNALGDITLRNGSRITANTGGNNAVRSFAFNGTITVDGDTGSFIDNVGTSFTGIHIGTVGGSTTFDVRDTGSDVDLDVSVNLVNAVFATGSLVKTGAGTLLLGAASSYSGGTTVSDGVLAVGNNAALGSGGVTLSGGILDVAGFTLSNAIAVSASGGGILGSGTLSGAISGSGELVFGNDGSLTLSGSNAGFSGGVSLVAGTLVAGNVNAFGSGVITLSGGTLDLGGLAIANTINFAGGALIGTSASTSAVTVTGPATAQEINALPGTEITLGSGANVDLTGVTKTVVVTGTPAGVNLASFGGTLAVTGTLDLSSAGNRPSSAVLELRQGGTIDFGDETAFTGQVQYKGGSIEGAFTGIANVSGTGVALLDGAVSGGTIVVGSGASVDVSAYTGAVRLTGGSVDTGLASFAGTIELGASGSLDLTTSPASLATVVIENGGVLRGTGLVGNLTVASGGQLSPGNSPGITTVVGNMVLEAGGFLDMEIQNTGADFADPGAGTDYDSVVVQGSLDLSSLSVGNEFVIRVISLLDATTEGPIGDFDPSIAKVYDVFSYQGQPISDHEGSLLDLFTLDTTGFVPGDGIAFNPASFSLFLNAQDSKLQLVYAPIPEPSTYGLILGGLALAGAAIRRRRARKDAR